MSVTHEWIYSAFVCYFSMTLASQLLGLKHAAGKHNASAFHFTQTAAPKTSISVSHVRFESEGNLYICPAVCHVCIYFFNAYLDTEHTGGKGGRVISESSSEKDAIKLSHGKCTFTVFGE